MLSDARDSLESEIVDYASDYDRAEYARSTRWPLHAATARAAAIVSEPSTPEGEN